MHHSSKSDIRRWLTNKVWIGPGGECLFVYEDTVFFPGYAYEQAALSVHKNALTLTTEYSTKKGKLKRSIDLPVVRVNDDTLVLQNVDSRLSRGGGNEVVFVDRNKVYDPSVVYEKIFFSIQGQQVEADASGDVTYVGSCPGLGIGTFKGSLTPQQWRFLSDLANKSIPERFALRRGLEDACMMRFRFYSKGKMKEAAGQAVPHLAVELENFLQLIPYEISLHKISDRCIDIKP